ncbi:MAG TPA: TIR domain-containing protein [Steroidobacteraceae bacterium]|nr:TIR domain-containing protein [Steroidobacteraceae bacterium]
MAEGDGMDGASGGIGSRTVFLSYASQDTEVANTVCRELESRGIGCWIAPRDVAPGALYADAIVRAINEAKVLLIVLSQSAVASSHVGREIERAASKHKQIIALRIDTASLSPELEYFLSNSQWIDVAALGMPAALSKLADALGRDSTTSPRSNPALGAAATQIGRRSSGAPKRIVAAVAVVIVAFGAVFAMRFWPSKHGDALAPAIAQISDKSIAVLPFADMSEKKDQEYFGDGMAEEILDSLAKVPGLYVIGRTSSFQFKGKNDDLRKIGEALGAAHVVEGSVRRSGNRIRVTAQLVRAVDGAHEWSESYDRDVGDAIEVQKEIAVSLSRVLQVTVEAGTLSLSGAKSPAAYDLFLRGLQAYEHFDKVGLEQAADYFRQALDLEPDFTRAAESLALSHLVLADDGFVATQEGWERARGDVDCLVSSNPRSAMGHGLLARIHTDYDWDWEAARREAAASLAIDPHTTIGHYAAGALWNALGKWADAESQFRAALSTDPLNPDLHQILGSVLYGAGRYEEAAVEHRRAIEIDPSFTFGHFELAMDLLALGQAEAALPEMQLESLEGGKMAGLARIYHSMGRNADSDVALARVTHDAADIHAYEIAMAHADRGETDQALEWLERAYRQRDIELVFLKGERIAPSLKTDSRYKAFLLKMKLLE